MFIQVSAQMSGNQSQETEAFRQRHSDVRMLYMHESATFLMDLLDDFTILQIRTQEKITLRKWP
jgi:hypothetical protein